jgi:hypothetical protein
MHHYAIYVQNISLKGYQWYLMRYIINNLIQYKYLGVLIKMSKISPKLIKITVVMSKTINQRIFFMSKFTYFSDKPFFVASNWVNFFCGAICYCDGLEWNNPNSMLLLWKVQRSKGPLRPLQGYPVLTHKRILCPVKRVKSWCEPLIMFVCIVHGSVRKLLQQDVLCSSSRGSQHCLLVSSHIYLSPRRYNMISLR